jgi:putative transcriptional regulator
MAARRGVLIPEGPHAGRVNATALSRGTEISYVTAFRLVNHPEQTEGLGFDTLARLCAFLKCQPGDLIEYIPDPDGRVYTQPERLARPITEGAISQW